MEKMTVSIRRLMDCRCGIPQMRHLLWEKWHIRRGRNPIRLTPCQCWRRSSLHFARDLISFLPMASNHSSLHGLIGALALVLTGVVRAAAGMEPTQPELASHTPNGEPTQGICFLPTLSPTGRFTAFTCYSFDILPGEPGVGDGLMHDATVDSIIGLSYDEEGKWAHCGNAELGTCTSRTIAIETNGAHVVMNSAAPLVSEAPFPTPDAGSPEVYLRDIAARLTTWLTPTPPNAASLHFPVGRDVSFDRSELLYRSAGNEIGGPDENGYFVADLFVKNWLSGHVELISTSLSGGQGNASTTAEASFSPDGRYVVFISRASNLTSDNPLGWNNLFLRDRVLGTTRRLTFPAGVGEFTAHPTFASQPVITSDNRYVLFALVGAQLVEDADPNVPLSVYEIDLQTGQTRLISRGVNDEPLNASAFGASFSDDGRYMAFETAATNVSEDPGPLPGVFVRDRLTGETINVSEALGMAPHTLPGHVTLSADGSTVAFAWPKWNATYPTLLDNQQIYKVRLRGDLPPVDSVAVPVASRHALGLLVLLLSLAALLAARTTQQW